MWVKRAPTVDANKVNKGCVKGFAPLPHSGDDLTVNHVARTTTLWVGLGSRIRSLKQIHDDILHRMMHIQYSYPCKDKINIYWKIRTDIILEELFIERGCKSWATWNLLTKESSKNSKAAS